MTFLIVASGAAGLFAGAAIYVTAVEHPARGLVWNRGRTAGVHPSYRRGAIMQASLALVGCLACISASATASSEIGIDPRNLK